MPYAKKSKRKSEYLPIFDLLRAQINRRVTPYNDRIHCLILLNKLVGWQNAADLKEDGRRWIVRSAREWSEDTDLTRKPLEKAFDLLEKNGFIKKRDGMWQGRTHRQYMLSDELWYDVNHQYAQNGSRRKLKILEGPKAFDL